jgi:hypothetical protein
MALNDFWIITTYYNPANYKTRLLNYEFFKQSLHQSGANLLTVECTFEKEDFTLRSSRNLLRVRSNSVIWQKERMINLAVSVLPIECTKVAWLDCDILFENKNWAKQASKMLDKYPVAQMFETVVRLPKGQKEYTGHGSVYRSFGSVLCERPNSLMEGFPIHGHTGFGWAIRRNILARCGLYDVCFTGSSDHLMAHSFCGDWTSRCVTDRLDFGSKHWVHFVSWSKKIHRSIHSKIGSIPGRILHLWHGEEKERKYLHNNIAFKAYNFDPNQDIHLNKNGLWEWNNPLLENWSTNMFFSRNEDGN